MLNHEVGRRMLRNALQAIEWISDKAYQRRTWIGGEEPNDFDETVCYFFDNVDLVLKEHIRCGLTSDQYKILKKFSEKFRSFSETNSYEPLFIDTPEWAEIMGLAKEVLKAFDYKE